VVVSLLNIGLDYVLIFGWNFIPPLGATGAALGRIASQAVLCFTLLILFLSRSNREAFGTDSWRLSPKLFWHYIRPGTLRALGAFFALGDWVLVSRLMTLKSEAHLLVFSIGSTLFYFLTFIGDGIFQTMVTMASNQIGKRDYTKVWSSFYSGLALLGLFAVCLTVPFFVSPQLFINCFSASSFYAQLPGVFQQIDVWICLAVIAYGLNLLSLGILVAARDTTFLFWVYCCLWLVSYLPIYATMNWLGWPPGQFWLIVTCSNLTCCFTFLWRASKEKWKVEQWQPTFPAPEADLSAN
jgi:Na+-driven multidrug efflux pump